MESTEILCCKCGDPAGYHTSYIAPFLRCSPGTEWGRFKECAGNDGTFGYFHHTDLYEYECEQIEGCIYKSTSQTIKKLPFPRQFFNMVCTETCLRLLVAGQIFLFSQHSSAMVYSNFSVSSQPRQGSVMDFPYTWLGPIFWQPSAR